MMRENRWIRIGYNDITNNIPIYGGIEHFLGGETSVNRKTSSWWTCQTLRMSTDICPSWAAEALVDTSSSTMDDFEPMDVANLLWSFARWDLGLVGSKIRTLILRCSCLTCVSYECRRGFQRMIRWFRQGDDVTTRRSHRENDDQTVDLGDFSYKPWPISWQVGFPSWQPFPGCSRGLDLVTSCDTVVSGPGDLGYSRVTWFNLYIYIYTETVFFQMLLNQLISGGRPWSACHWQNN